MTRGLPALLLAVALPVHAQAVFGVGVSSQYSVRGVPLSRGPVAQASVSWDGDYGAFAGAMVTHAKLRNARSGATGIAYGGIARRLGAGISGELGATAVGFRHASRYNYREYFAGLAWERVSARFYYSPYFYGVGGRSLYGEVNGSVPLGESAAVTLHAGRLHVREGEYAYYYRPPAQVRTDFHVGVTKSVENWTMHVALKAVHGDRSPYAARSRKRSLEAGINRSF